jgi:hypothetical protein
VSAAAIFVSGYSDLVGSISALGNKSLTDNIAVGSGPLLDVP